MCSERIPIDLIRRKFLQVKMCRSIFPLRLADIKGEIRERRRIHRAITFRRLSRFDFGFKFRLGFS